MRVVRTFSVLVAVAVLTGCAGEQEPQLAGPPREVGHGSVEEVLAALTAQGLPCQDPVPVDLPDGTEQAVRCDLQPLGEEVLVVHFLSTDASKAYEAGLRAAQDHGVYADAWAARTETAAAARLLARAVENRGRS